MLLTLIAKPFTGTDNCLHPDAVHYPASDNLDNLLPELGAGITWDVFHTVQAFLAGASPDGQHQTQLGRDAFLQMAAFPAQAAGEGLLPHFSRAMVASAATTLDTDTGAKDGQGQPVMASYFSGGSVVTLDTATGQVMVVGSIP